MPAAHTAEAMTIGDLLGGKRQFSIPSYQRDYSWTWKEAEQLITDLLAERQAIEDAPEIERSFYLGLMIVMDNAPPRRSIPRLRRGAGQPSEVIDGKQRLTTLTMLIALLRDLLGDDGEWLQPYLVEAGRNRQWAIDAPRLRLEDHEQAFLIEHVLPRGANLKASPRSFAHLCAKRMCSVRDHLRTRLRNRPKALLLNLGEMLIERCSVTTIVPSDITSGYRMFVTVNFRGKGLSTSDIVKAELVGAMDPTGRRKASEAWSALRTRLETDPDDQAPSKGAASLDNLLSHVHKLRCRPGTTIFQGLEDLAAAASSPLDFVKDTLEPLADIMLTVKRAGHSGSAASDRINRILTILNWLPSNDWVPVAMQVLHTHQRTPDQALEILRLLQRLAFAQAILGRGNDVREKRYRRAALAIANRADPSAPDSPLTLTGEETDLLVRFLSSNLYRSKGGYCKAVLAWLSCAGDETQPLPALEEFTVEHILPRTPGSISYWIERFPDAIVREHAIRSLGNLALVTSDHNDRVRNLSFPKKQAIFFEPGQVNPFDTTQMLAGFTDWTPETVLAREAMMLERAAKTWGFDLDGRPSKLASLLKP